MHIDEDHRHYGSALIQVAEHRHFTAINALRYKGVASRCAFRVNQDIGLYVRYRAEPQGMRFPVYTFKFDRDNLAELRRINKRVEHVFLGLVCVQDNEICCLPYSTFLEFVEARRVAKGTREDEYRIDVSIPRGKQLRVWISPPNTKGHYLREVLIPRSDFPSAMFTTVAAGVTSQTMR